MAVIAKTSVGLRIFGDDLDPDEITRQLGAQPTVGVRKGVERRRPSGHSHIALTGQWLLTAPTAAPGDLDEQIRALLATLTDDLEIWRDLGRRYRCDLFCGLFMIEGNEGIGLEPETVRLIGERGLKIDLDIYGAILSEKDGEAPR